MNPDQLGVLTYGHSATSFLSRKYSKLISVKVATIFIPKEIHRTLTYCRYRVLQGFRSRRLAALGGLTGFWYKINGHSVASSHESAYGWLEPSDLTLDDATMM